MKAVCLKTTRHVVLKDNIISHIRSRYQLTDPQTLEKLATQYQALRHDAASVNSHGDLTKGLSSLQQYLTYLSILSKYCDENISSYFEWDDLLQSQTYEGRSSLNWEMTCILYNIGAVHSLLGCHAHCQPDGTKLAVKHFQIAAGVFKFCDAHSKNGESQSHFIKASMLLMQAQAQMCYYEKSVSDNMGTSLRSKLAFGAAEFFRDSKLQLSAASTKLDASILAWRDLQCFCLMAAAHYQRAVSDFAEVDSRASGYGGLISRLRAADKLCEAATKIHQDFHFNVDFTQMKTQVAKWLQELEKDNKMIYLEVVPDALTLPPLELIISVNTPTYGMEKFCEVVDKQLETFFTGLIPLFILPYMESYRFKAFLKDNVQQKRQSQIESITKALEEKRPMLMTMLCGVDRRSVEAVWNVIKDIQSKGGIKSLEGIVESLKGNAAICAAELGELSSILSGDPYRQDEAGRKWLISVNDLQNRLKMAKNANDQVEVKLKQTKGMHGALQSSSISLLEGEIPSFKSSAAETNNRADKVGKARQAFKSLEKSKSELTEFESNIDDTNESQLKTALKEAYFNHASEEKLEEIASASADNIKTLLETPMKTAHEAFCSFEYAFNEIHQLTNSSENPSFVFIRDLNIAASAIQAAYGEAVQGETFFSALADRVTDIKQKIDEYIRTQRRPQVPHYAPYYFTS